MNNVKRFLATKAVRRASAGRSLPFDRDWGFGPDEWVDITIRRADLSDEPIYATKKTCKMGGGIGIFLRKSWGFEAGELLTFSVERRKDAVGRFTDVKPRKIRMIEHEGLPESPAFDVPSTEDKAYEVPKVEDLMYDDIGIEDKEGN